MSHQLDWNFNVQDVLWNAVRKLFFLDFFTLEDRTDRLFRNVGN
jgi:hypothetical protein